LWDVALRDELRHALVVEECRAIHRWTARYRLATVTWPDTPLDPFFNANTIDDLAEADGCEFRSVILRCALLRA